jgi:hypothetical protein
MSTYGFLLEGRNQCIVWLKDRGCSLTAGLEATFGWGTGLGLRPDGNLLMILPTTLRACLLSWFEV